jgi:hypothetical protein
MNDANRAQDDFHSYAALGHELRFLKGGKRNS